ncbi:hypothetical protein D5086_024299 [Populus alba]|uniref:Uncharacterized protein n=1 Tax=Populus alba TaxID=43335 RepID=A0ACC4B5Q9_POPAL
MLEGVESAPGLPKDSLQALKGPSYSSVYGNLTFFVELGVLRFQLTLQEFHVMEGLVYVVIGWLESATKALESNCDKDIHDSIINCNGDITATLQVHDSLICNDRGSRHQKLYLPAF